MKHRPRGPYKDNPPVTSPRRLKKIAEAKAREKKEKP